jgi:spermidine/putrescine-binding protein
MKKLLPIILSLAFALTGCGTSGEPSVSNDTDSTAGTTLKVYNWGEYTGENVIANFEKEYNCKVITEYFDSNEMMYTKLQAGDSYDVIVPSDYMIERLVNDDMLQPLNKELIPNLDVLTDTVKNRDFDPDNTYSAPYFCGTVGIVYNKNNVSMDKLKSEGWDILKDPEYKGQIYMYDSERDSFMVALKALGYSMNTDDAAQLQEAFEWLKEQKAATEPVYVTDEVIDGMATGTKDMAVVYSGDAAYILQENPDMGYYIPKQGTNIWCDSMVIPANAKNAELANKYINYILDYEASMDNTSTVGYTTPNKDVFNDVTADGGIFADNEAYNSQPSDKDEIFHDNEVIRRTLSDLWIKVKSE